MACALLIAAAGLYALDKAGPAVSVVSFYFAAIDFKGASASLRPDPQGQLDVCVSAAALALTHFAGLRQPPWGSNLIMSSFGYCAKHLFPAVSTSPMT